MAVKTRIEILLNQAVEEDLMDRLGIHKAGTHFTRIAPVFGKGRSGERRGDHIWPEENVLFIMYCSESERDRIIASVREVKRLFPEEGIKLFAFETEVFEL